MSFAPDFLFYSDGRARDQTPTAAFWDTICGEMEVELDHRTRFYPSRVAKGRMKRTDADLQLRVWQALVDDCVPARAAQGAAGATWAEKLHALRREIAMRRKFYPDWVAAGRMTQADADRRLHLIEQLHDMWWHSAVADCIGIREETDRIRDHLLAA